MPNINVITDAGTTEVSADLAAGEVRVASDVLDSMLGWHLDQHGLCRGDVCLPLLPDDKPDADGRVDLIAMASRTGRPSIVDTDAGVVALGVARDDRRRALRDLELPDFTLPDLDGRPVRSTDWRGRKTLLLAFSSW